MYLVDMSQIFLLIISGVGLREIQSSTESLVPRFPTKVFVFNFFLCSVFKFFSMNLKMLKSLNT